MTGAYLQRLSRRCPFHPCRIYLVVRTICCRSLAKCFKNHILFSLIQDSPPSCHGDKLPIYNTNKIILDLERGRPQVWQVNGVLREEGLGLLVVDRGVDDDIVSLLPVDGGGDAVLVTGLKG